VYPELGKKIEKNKAGVRKLPVGSPRDFFLHVEEKYIPEVRQAVQEICGEKALIITTEELIEAGCFGKRESISDEMKNNLAPLVVLPRPGESVFWRGKGKYQKNFLGHHGGLTSAEMDSIFLALNP